MHGCDAGVPRKLDVTYPWMDSRKKNMQAGRRRGRKGTLTIPTTPSPGGRYIVVLRLAGISYQPPPPTPPTPPSRISPSLRTHLPRPLLPGHRYHRETKRPEISEIWDLADLRWMPGTFTQGGDRNAMSIKGKGWFPLWKLLLGAIVDARGRARQMEKNDVEGVLVRAQEN